METHITIKRLHDWFLIKGVLSRDKYFPPHMLTSHVIAALYKKNKERPTGAIVSVTLHSFSMCSIAKYNRLFIESVFICFKYHFLINH